VANTPNLIGMAPIHFSACHEKLAELKQTAIFPMLKQDIVAVRMGS
jgi:hypothetical protein